MYNRAIYVGTAGWNIRAEFRDKFSTNGSHLERYASQFNAVEINSSFYKPHRMTTYERWAASVPDDFRFSVKAPKTITHKQMLVDVTDELKRFLGETSGLGKKLGVILVQLPPKLRFRESVAAQFFSLLRTCYRGPVVCEPRHLSWLGNDVERLFIDYRVSRVAADPSIGTAASVPSGAKDILYYRWHGSPYVYYSSYSDQQLVELSRSVSEGSDGDSCVWCVFDNTARGAATSNALALRDMLGN